MLRIMNEYDSMYAISYFCFFKMYLKLCRSDSGLSYSMNSLINFCSDNSVRLFRYSHSLSLPKMVWIAFEKMPTALMAERSCTFLKSFECRISSN